MKAITIPNGCKCPELSDLQDQGKEAICDVPCTLRNCEFYHEMTICYTCDGRGTIPTETNANFACPECEGQGSI